MRNHEALPNPYCSILPAALKDPDRHYSARGTTIPLFSEAGVEIPSVLVDRPSAVDPVASEVARRPGPDATPYWMNDLDVDGIALWLAHIDGGRADLLSYLGTGGPTP
jgi:hypothetical protein